MSSTTPTTPTHTQSTPRTSTRTTKGRPPLRFADYLPSAATRASLTHAADSMNESDDPNATILAAENRRRAEREDQLLAAITALTCKVSNLQTSFDAGIERTDALERNIVELRAQNAVLLAAQPARAPDRLSAPPSSSVVIADNQPPTQHPRASTSTHNSSLTDDVGANSTACSVAVAPTPAPRSSFSFSGVRAHFSHSEQPPAIANVEPPVSIVPAQQQRRPPPYVSHLAELPAFSGAPEDWPSFKSAYRMSSDYYGFGDVDNNFRLKKCLQGEAKLAVRSLLIHPNNAATAMAALEMRFGRPELLVRSQLQVVRDLPTITEQRIDMLVPFATEVQSVVAFLDQPETAQHLANPLLMDELLSKLPMSRRVDWGRHAAGIKPYATLCDLGAWLEELAQYVGISVLPTTKSSGSNTSVSGAKRADKQRTDRVMLTDGIQRDDNQSCAVCDRPAHKTSDCPQFKRMTVEERWKVVSEKRLCISCLTVGHTSWRCKARKKCGTDNCARSHHRLLHATEAAIAPRELNRPFAQTTGTNNAPAPSNANNNPTSNASTRDTPNWSGLMVTRPTELMYRIVPVNLYNGERVVSTFALFDEGSFTSMIDFDLAKELRLQGDPSTLNLQWINEQSLRQDCTVVKLEISGVAERDRRYELEQVKTVRGLKLPVQTTQADRMCGDFPEFAELPLASYTNARPQLLLGLRHCHLGVSSKTVQTSADGPVAALTNLGWVVYGPRMNSRGGEDTDVVLFASEESDDLRDLEERVRDYFSLESFGVRCPARPLESDADIRARQLLATTTKRIGERFETGLLWRTDQCQLPESRAMAMRRLTSVEAKMRKCPEYSRAYEDNLMAYVSKGYARKLSEDEVRETTERTWYLPHFGVVNPHKPGKLRIVFDAAAAVHGVSLNSVLLKGPDLNQPMTEVLHQFRVGVIGVCGDVREMFSQIMIRPADRDSQRFLWRHGDTSRQVETYEMMAMTFGAACSPCSAQYVKNINAEEHAHIDVDAVKAIKRNHYVDDYVISFPTIAEASRVTRAVIDIHRRGGFDLRKLVSNSVEVLRAIGCTDSDPAGDVDMQLEGGNVSEKVLGMYWDTNTDTFRFQFRFYRVSADVLMGTRKPTKRELLSIAMSVFDPFGMLANYTIYAKVLLQEVWRTNTGWDETIKADLCAKWELWFAELPSCGLARVPRCYSPHLLTSSMVQLHVFADASSVAYAAVAFWRVQTGPSQFELAFVAGKSRCAGMKLTTIPRLELQAAVMATRLANSVLACHDVQVSKTWLWTDSKTVVQWIRSDARRYKAFVGHRIAEILEDSDVDSWRWVPTADNVADDATRTKYPPKYDPNGRWLQGPAFLLEEEERWPSEASEPEASDVLEELKAEFTSVVQVGEIERTIEFEKFDNFHKLRRTLAWMYRFIGNVRAKMQQQTTKRGELDAAEIEKAERQLSRIAQRESFPAECAALEQKKSVERNSSVFRMLPFLDVDGVMRVRGRTDAAAYMTDFAKNPVILAKQHRLASLIVEWEHKRMRHQQQEAVVCAVQQRYCIPHLRQLVRSVKSRCQTCRIRSATPVVPIMGQLPEDRLTPYVRPFTYTGLDYFGPIFVAVGRRREKRWVALFTCMTVRAVHLELAADLSTDACLMCIRNFVNLRGVPIRIRSDNGTNFVGAANVLKGSHDFFDHAEMQRALGVDRIEWVFNAPGNPEAGGCWERMVQSVKKVLSVSLHELAPKVETLRSLLIEAANIVNSRPLTYLPLDAADAEPLTPNHFLLGCSNSTQTPGPTDLRQICQRKQLNVLQQLKNRFWKRWIHEYLPVLTRRAKGFVEVAPLKPGDLVLICEDGQPRGQWRRGRVQEVFAGSDGRVRVAMVKTSGGILRRAVSKLAVLDVSCEAAGDASRGGGCC